VALHATDVADPIPSPDSSIGIWMERRRERRKTMYRWFKVGDYERGFVFRGRDFVEVLGPGNYVRFDPLFRLWVEIQDVTEPRIECDRLDVIVKMGVLGNEALVVDLADGERALVWVDKRLESVLGPGLYAYWTIMKDVRVEVVDATKVRISTSALAKLLSLPGTAAMIDMVDVDASSVGLYFLNGVYQETLSSGRYAFWKGEGRVEVRKVDLREQLLDVNGQEIMTKDKVTLRLNAVLTYSVIDAEKCFVSTSDYVQLIYREVQLVLRAVIGTRTLDEILDGKDAVADELQRLLEPRLAKVGLVLGAFGIKDVILPGEMRELLNRVTEAKKAAEANLVSRREEVAAVRSQLNAARLIESNPTLMRLRELEVLEKITEKATLNVVLGDKGLADKVVKLLSTGRWRNATALVF
jgi:regulator of protease activity HflC (stomatin/prohibitin superfamily)